MRVRFSYDIFRGQRHGGVSRYVLELHRGLLERGVDSRILAGLHRNEGAAAEAGVLGLDVDAIRPEQARQALTKVADRAFERLWVPGQDRSTIYHKTYFDRWVPRSGPTLAVTVYDMIHERFPEDVSPRDVTPGAKRPWVERADIVFAISATTRDDLVDEFCIDPDRVVVTPLGVRPTVPDASVVVADGRPFVLFVGTRGPKHKNVDRFVEAFAQSDSRREVALVFFGGGPFSAPERSRFAELGLDDVWAVSGDDAVLAAHFAQARAFVYPSLYEGFGLPPLEAMSQGCPVAAADVASIPAVVGDAAVRFDPYDLDDMAAAIDTVVGDEVRRSELRQAGERQVAAHPWSRTVDLSLDAYRGVAPA